MSHRQVQFHSVEVYDVNHSLSADFFNIRTVKKEFHLISTLSSVKVICTGRSLKKKNVEICTTDHVSSQ